MGMERSSSSSSNSSSSSSNNIEYTNVSVYNSTIYFIYIK